MYRALLSVCLLIPTLAFADVPPDDGGGCRCEVSNASTAGAAALAPVMLLAAAMMVRRRR